jgi:hypothetical protein
MFICWFVSLINKNVFLSTTLCFPVVIDGQFTSHIQKERVSTKRTGQYDFQRNKLKLKYV